MSSNLKETSHPYQVGDRVKVVDGDYRGAVVVILGQPKMLSLKVYRCEVVSGGFDRFISVEEDHFDSNTVIREDEEI